MAMYGSQQRMKSEMKITVAASIENQRQRKQWLVAQLSQQQRRKRHQ